MPSGAGSAVALPCHMVRGVEGVGACLPGTSGREAWGISAGNHDVAQFFPPCTVSRDVWHAALRPDVSGVTVDALLFHEAGSQLVHRYRVYKDPFPHPALRDGVIPRLLSCVCRAMVIGRLTHLRISIPSSGAPPGRVPVECFPEATFAEEVTTLNADESPEFSPVSPPLILPVVMDEAAVVSATGAMPLIMPVVEGIENDPQAAELVEMQTTTSESGVPPPPGFPPFLFPENDGGMDADDEERVHLFAGACLCLQEHHIPCFGLCGAGGRVRTSPEPSVIRRENRSPTVRRTAGAQWKTVGRQTF